jgi:hypothetical protein
MSVVPRADHLGSAGPAAYFITLSTYGARLHGDERGSVRRDSNTAKTPLYGRDERLEEAERAQMTHEPFVMDAAQRGCVVEQILETSGFRGWPLHAMNVRTRHAHVVVSAPGAAPERVMNDLKVWSTKRLRASQLVPPDQPLWSRHGSTIYIWRDEDISEVCWYVNERQGDWIPGCGAPRPGHAEDAEAGAHQPLARVRRPDPVVGLCAVCRHSRRVRSAKGSEFWLCQAAATDLRLQKYARLPVLDCLAFEPRGADAGSSSG